MFLVRVQPSIPPPRLWWHSEIHQPADSDSTESSPSFTAEAPFTMTGQLVIGQVGLPNLIVDIQGSGILTGCPTDLLLSPDSSDCLQSTISIRRSRTVKCIAAVHWGQRLACRAPKTDVGRPPRLS